MPSIQSFMETHHLVKGIDPVADFMDGTKTTTVVNLANYGRAAWVIYKGAGATGTSVITVEACDSNGANPVAVPFRYRAITTGDTPGTPTDVAATGFTTTAGSSQLYLVEIDSEALAASGKHHARLKAVESANDPVLGGILCILPQPRFAQSITPTAAV